MSEAASNHSSSRHSAITVLAFAWAALVVLLDQVSKWWIVKNYQWGEYTPVTGFFNIVRVHNHGAAFSFLADHGGWQRWFFIVLACLVSVFIALQLVRGGLTWLAALGFSSVLGGAVGNVVDRIHHGYVVDMLDFYWGSRHFPAFNLADMAITLGVICLITHELFRPKEEAP